MRLLVDQDVYQITITWLSEQGHDVVTAREFGLQRAPDENLLKAAKELGRLLVTRDKDFGALVFLEAQATSGVILLRMSYATILDVHHELKRLLNEHEEEELRTCFSVVEPQRYRMRRLPTESQSS